MQRVSLALIVVGVLFGASSTAQAGSLLFATSGAGASGAILDASALFEISGDSLRITLRNAGDSTGDGDDLSADPLIGVISLELPTGVTLNTPVQGDQRSGKQGRSPALVAADQRGGAPGKTMAPLVSALISGKQGKAGLEDGFFISNVSFQYGSDFSEPKLPAGMVAPASIPEPATLLLLVPAIGFAARRRLRAQTAR